MKIFDRYVAKSFLIGYVIAFCVLVGLRIIIELFVHLDEFTEHAELGTVAVLKNIFIFYGLNSTLYFRDFAGMITVLAAVFSIGKMVRSNELVAVMASGVSLKRVIEPIIVLALLLTGLLIVNQEFIIPPLADGLVRAEDDLPGQESYAVWFMHDDNGSLIFSREFDVGTSTLYNPTILPRRKKPESVGTQAVWEVIGRVSAEKALNYNPETGEWALVDGRFLEKGSEEGLRPMPSWASDITPKNIPVRLKAGYKALLSWRQLSTLAAQGPQKDLAQLYAQMHFHITDPIMSVVILLVSLPILVCRDPKSMKTAIMISFGVTAMCLITTFVCKMLATEIVFGRVRPEFWAWLPIFIFAPIAFIELDSMKT
jgi:lipopolysaccharide export system permease protein